MDDLLDCHCGGGRLPLVILEASAFLFLGDSGQAQSNFMVGLVQFDDFEIVFFTDGKTWPVLLTVEAGGDFRIVTEAFDARRQFYKCAETRMAAHAAANEIAHLMRAEKRLPRIRLQLLNAERQAPVIAVDAQNRSLHQLPFFQYLGRMLDPLGPT